MGNKFRFCCGCEDDVCSDVDIVYGYYCNECGGKITAGNRGTLKCGNYVLHFCTAQCREKYVRVCENSAVYYHAT